MSPNIAWPLTGREKIFIYRYTIIFFLSNWEFLSGIGKGAEYWPQNGVIESPENIPKLFLNVNHILSVRSQERLYGCAVYSGTGCVK